MPVKPSYAAKGVYTEALIKIDKEIAIQGEGADVTIVQAAASPDRAEDPVFYLFDTADVTIRDITVRHGYNLDCGGGIVSRRARGRCRAPLSAPTGRAAAVACVSPRDNWRYPAANCQ